MKAADRRPKLAQEIKNIIKEDPFFARVNLDHSNCDSGVEISFSARSTMTSMTGRVLEALELKLTVNDGNLVNGYDNYFFPA